MIRALTCGMLILEFKELYDYLITFYNIWIDESLNCQVLFKDGIFGALIVREDKSTDINGDLYDFDMQDHHIMLNEWFNITFQINYGVHLNAGLYSKIFPILINGKGNLKYQPDLSVPMATFIVKKGFRYRFRLINVGIDHCQYQISFENHNMTVISSDGQPLEPIEVDSIVSNTGERYDFVINANADIEKDYWIKVRSDPDCEGRG
jgi:FtsP/CotA-like multicopper oxidase with cupredoxin domain